MDVNYVKSLNIKQLQALCKQYRIPINGAKNKKELLGRILVRRQMFKCELPNDIYRQIFIFCAYCDILSFRLCCKTFCNMINDEFWEEKIKLDFKLDNVKLTNQPLKSKSYFVDGNFDYIHDSRLKYVKLITQKRDLVKGSEFFMPKSECMNRVKVGNKNSPLITYFENCKERWDYKYYFKYD